MAEGSEMSLEEMMEFNALIAAVFARTDQQMVELYGNKEELPEDEDAIVADDTLTHQDKVKRLKALRARKRRLGKNLIAFPNRDGLQIGR